MEVMITRKNVVLDATVLSTLMSCARLAQFRFGMNLMSIHGKSTAMEMGSICHAVVEYYYKAIMAGSHRREAIELGFKAGRVLANDPEKTRNCSESDIELAFQTMTDYFEYYKNDSWIPLAVEEVRGEIVYEDDEIRILWKAKYDAIVDSNQGIFPCDHKTMKQRRDTLTLNNQFIGQCLLMKTRQMVINKIGFQTSLKPHEKFTRPILSYSADLINEWQSEILPYYAKLMLLYEESGYWPPNFTHCENKYGNCAFVDVCKANPNLREDELRSNFVVGEPWDPSND